LLLRLEQQSRILDITLSSISDFAYIFDRRGRFAFVNQALLNLWGLKLEDAIGKNFFELKYPDELAARLEHQIQEVFTTKQGLTDETPYTSPTGVGGYYEYIFRPVFDREGNVELVAGSTRDITERKRVEAELRESQERLRVLAESLESQVQDRTRELEIRTSDVIQQSEHLRELSVRLMKTQDEERRRIGGGVFVREAFPIDQVGGLRPLVRHFAVVALTLHEEVERFAGQTKVAVAVDREERVESVAAKVPAEAGAR